MLTDEQTDENFVKSVEIPLKIMRRVMIKIIKMINVINAML